MVKGFLVAVTSHICPLGSRELQEVGGIEVLGPLVSRIRGKEVNEVSLTPCV